MEPPRQPAPAASRVLPSTRGRDILIAVVSGIAVLAFILYAISYFSRQADSTGGVNGTILAKEFVAQPEEEITFGRGGLSTRHSAGEYVFRVKVARENGRVYRVTVNPGAYNSHQVGDAFYFLHPPLTSGSTSR